MRKFLFLLALVVAGALCFNPSPPSLSAGSVTSGDSALAAAGSFKIYPLFTDGGAHIHAAQWVTADNGLDRAYLGGYLYTSSAALRVNVYGAGDTSGFTLPPQSTVDIPPCDSLLVLTTGGATTVTWRLAK